MYGTGSEPEDGDLDAVDAERAALADGDLVQRAEPVREAGRV